MNILNQIVSDKKKEVEDKKSFYPIKFLERSIFFKSEVVSLSKYLLREDKTGIIAEFKRKSPSRGFINKYASVEKTTIGYMQSGASALSILTDSIYFGGTNQDLTDARKFNYCPILRKDFIIDEYQIIESKSIGADAILLLANVLNAQQIKQYSTLASSLGLEVLLEIRDKEELDKISEHVSVVGVNNRDLKTFETSIQKSFELGSLIPNHFLKISESGIETAKDIIELKKAGFNGFLIGETFMKNASPEQKCKELIKNVNEYKSLVINEN